MDGHVPAWHEDRIAERSAPLASGTLACPRCDVPVVPDGPLAPSHPLACPYCGESGAVRDFLSLTQPTRPTHVVVRISRSPVRR